jgi:hypothetical protein
MPNDSITNYLNSQESKLLSTSVELEEIGKIQIHIGGNTSNFLNVSHSQIIEIFKTLKNK